MVHLGALPGAPRFAHDLEDVVRRALDDARTLAGGGCDALLVENFGDTPFYPDVVPAETVAAMTRCVREIVAAVAPLAVGVNVLRNDARAALAICAATDARFVRVNVHAGVAAADQGLLLGRAHDTVRERARWAPHVAILADVLVKHATPLGRASLTDCIEDVTRRAHADAVIVSGSATGRAPDAAALREAHRAARGVPVFAGSGIDALNAGELLGTIDGAIVGTSLKKDGDVHAAVDPERVRAFRAALERVRRATARA
ncbi:MAG: BtpA/SgcQ family protein [Planctomycetota bacterium]